MYLDYIQWSKVLSQWQARGADILLLYNFIIRHLEVKQNPADEPSRRPHNEIGNESLAVWPLTTSALTSINKSYGDILLEIKIAQGNVLLATQSPPTLVDIPIIDASHSKSIDCTLTYQRRIYMPAVLHSCVNIIPTTIQNPVTSWPWRLHPSPTMGFYLACCGILDTEVYCKLKVMPLNQGTTSCTL